MKFLVEDWKKISRIGYSTLCFYILAAMTIAPDVIYYLTGIDTNPVIWGRLQILFIALGVIGRLVIQPAAHRWKRRGFIFLFLIALVFAAVPAMAHVDQNCKHDLQEVYMDEFERISFELISKWEGLELCAYQDIVGVWTIGYGHTKTARAGQCITEDVARQMLNEEIASYRMGLHFYFDQETISARLTPHRDAAYTSIAYNVGIRAAGRSTATRRLNKGEIAGGCDALTWWDKAGGRRVRGLVNRRAEEKSYCLRGL